jgi:alpha-beta hydrolase superfamily lysophospholipase
MSALVIMVHGIGEHSGCYEYLAEKFTRHSVGFLAFDLRGHGSSPGIRGHASIQLIMDDLQAIVETMQQKFPDIPIILFGHSMGGQIVLSCAGDSNIKVQGVIASSPWLKLVRPPSLWLVWLAQWASHVVPWLTVRTGIRADQLSQDGDRIKSTKKDPLLHKRISIKLFSDLWTNSKILLRNKIRLNIPCLLMHGTADTLVSYKTSKSFAKRNRKFIYLKSWYKMRHDLLHDAGNEVVFRYVIHWLSKYVVEKWNCSEQ